MNRKLFFLINLVLISTLLLTNCGPVTPVQIATPTLPPTQTIPDIQVQEDQVAPYLVELDPPAGQRLELSPEIRFRFDRDMDQKKTESAFTLLDLENEPVTGKVTWPNPRTVSFRPDSALAPSQLYRAIFSTSAVGADGKQLQEEIRLDFTTTDTLSVSQVFPIHDAEDVDSRTNVTVIFNQPVVPLRIKEEQSDLPQPLEFSPEVAGQGEWVNSSVYVFQPEQPLLTGTYYTVRVKQGLKDTLGSELAKPYVWQFSTRTPVIGNLALKNGMENPPDNLPNVLLDQAFLVTFLQPMEAESAREHVALIDRESRKPFPIRMTWNEEFTILTIEPVGRYKIASFYELVLPNQLRAKDGGTLKDGWNLKFGTVPLPRIRDISPEPNSEAKDFDPRLMIRFASPMKLASLKDKIRITPQPPKELQWYFDDHSWELNVYGLEPATDYVVRVLPGMADIYGNTITSQMSFTFKTGDLFPYARIVLPWQPLVYRAQGPQEVFFEQVNLDSGTISLYPVTFNEFTRLMTGKLDPSWFSPKAEPIREWEAVDANALRNEINRLNFKLQDSKEKPLQPGYYFIGVTGEPLDYPGRFYQGFVFIVATDNITLKTSSSEATAWVVDLESGKPQPQVSVKFYDQYLRELGEQATDKNGIAYLKKLKDPLYARVEGTDRVAFTSIEWGSGVWAGDFGLYEGYYSSPNASFSYLYTDRPVYRPGQDVFFKGIVRQNDDLRYSIPKDENVYVDIQLFGERVFGEYMPLSELGSFTGSFRLAEDAGLGTYDVFVSKGPGREAFGYLTFRVAEYRKPEFEILTSVDRSDVLAGEDVLFSLLTRYYSGGSLGNADVEWFLEATPYAFQPASDDYWQFNFIEWDRDEFWEPQQAGQQGVLAEGKTVTDGSGSLVITQTLGLVENKISQQVSFRANVTDVAGNVVSGSTSVIVHQSEIYAGVRSLDYVGKAGEEQPFEIVVLGWDSHPVPDQSVNVKFVERRWFSVQTQDKQGQLKWETSVKEIPITQTAAVTGDDGKATVSFIPPAGGVYKAIVTVRDSKGHTHQSSAYMWV